MRWRRSVAVLAGAASAALAIGTMTASPAGASTAGASSAGTSTAVMAAARPADTTFPAGHWGPAQPVAGLAALNAGGSAEVNVVSCHSPGFCTAAGTYEDAAKHNQVFTVTETGGVWGQAIPLPGLRNLNAGDANATAISCGDAGRCAVGGTYTDSNGVSQPYVSDSLGGSFASIPHTLIHLGGQPQKVTTVTAISCTTGATARRR
jgi:hypothetical protein